MTALMTLTTVLPPSSLPAYFRSRFSAFFACGFAADTAGVLESSVVFVRVRPSSGNLRWIGCTGCAGLAGGTFRCTCTGRAGSAGFTFCGRADCGGIPVRAGDGGNYAVNLDGLREKLAKLSESESFSLDSII